MTTFGEWFGTLLLSGMAAGLVSIALGPIAALVVFVIAFLCMAWYAVTHP